MLRFKMSHRSSAVYRVMFALAFATCSPGLYSQHAEYFFPEGAEEVSPTPFVPGASMTVVIFQERQNGTWLNRKVYGKISDAELTRATEGAGLTGPSLLAQKGLTARFLFVQLSGTANSWKWTSL